jgi:hypothetical protein
MAQCMHLMLDTSADGGQVPIIVGSGAQ